MVHSNIFGGPHKRPRLCSWGECCWLIVPRLISHCSDSKLVYPETSCGPQSHQASPFRLRICRLMHRQLPTGSDKLGVQHRRNRRLRLDKKQGVFRTFPSSGSHRATLPSYFQKRLKRRHIGKCAISSRREAGEEVVEQPKDNESAQNSLDIDEVVPSLDTLKKNYKEFCAIQWTIRLWYSMLQERLEELEQGTESIENVEQISEALHVKPEEEKSECSTTPQGTVAEDRSENPAAVLLCEDKASEKEKAKKENDVPSERATSADRNPSSTPAKDGSKDDDVSLEGSVQNVAPMGEGMVTPNRTPLKEGESTRTSYSLLQTSKSDILDPAYTCDIELEPLENRKSSFVDSLLNKFNLSPPVKVSTGPLSCSFESGFNEGGESFSGDLKRRSLRDRNKIAARPRYIETPEEPRKLRVSKVFGQLHKSLNIDLECTNSNSSTEFYGFDEGEVVKLDKPSLPGLLPTPIVKKSQPYAPFLSYGSTIGATDDAGTVPETRSDLFREEGLISFGSLPPRLECPQRPNDMVRPRTVAQKRILLQKENDVRYLMIDNESKIFHFLDKRSKNIDAALDFQRMKELQDQPIPFTRDTWRALSWLRTEKGRYYFQTLNIDNRTVKLTGCQGNHPYRKLTRKPVFSSPVVASGGCRIHYITNCRCPEYPENLTLDIPQLLKPPPEKTTQSQRLKLLPDVQFPPVGDYRTHRSYPHTKPGPLSSKCVLRDTLEDDPYLGPREVFRMPPVELEVFPKINRPLDGYVKPFLKMILPHRGITENWARFAVSTLRPPVASDDGTAGGRQQQPSEERSFVFQLPYANNQRRMLIRRRLIVRPGTTLPAVDIDIERFEKLMKEQLTFRASIDSATGQDGGEVDNDERICADVLSEMTDSVAIALAEDVFQMDDPDVDYTRVDKPLGKEETAPPKPAVKTDTITPTITPPPPSSDAGTSSLIPATDTGEAPKVNSGAGASNPPAVTTECSKTNDPAKLKLLRYIVNNTVPPFPSSREMKRLNATIIEGPSQAKSSAAAEVTPRPQQCDPQYCAQGCICDVLFGSQAGGAVASAMRKQHCRQVDCVFECKCGYEQKKAANYSERDSGREVNSDAKPLFSADMKHLHEEVTERLAKEERQFTSTVIVTDEAAVVVRNAESETRRQKKMPKKYDDYYNEKSVQCLLNGGVAVEPTSFFVASEPPANVKPLSTADRIRHAHVVLNPLPELEDLEPWCMVHELYRCFCGGTATQGKPFSFTEESIVSASSKVTVSGGSVGAATPAALKPVNGTVATASRMMKAPAAAAAASSSSKTSNKMHMLNGSARAEQVAPAAAWYDPTPRKRLYSFEKPHTAETESEQQRRARSDRFGGHSVGPGATASSSQSVAFRRRGRDSSEESYKPPSEKKSSKAKKVQFSAEARRASVAVRRDSVVASRASLPKRRASIAAREKASFFANQEVDEPSPPPAAALKVAIRRSEPMGAPKPPTNVQYTIVSQPTKNTTGKKGISNLIIKRIPPTPPPLPSPLPSISPSSSIQKSASSGGNTQASTSGANVMQKVVPPLKERVKGGKEKTPMQMTVLEVRKLLRKEYNSVIEKAKAEKEGGGVDQAAKRRHSTVPVLLHIDLVDTDENIDSLYHLNQLTDGRKKLVICGTKRSYVANEEFQDGKPPSKYIPFTDRLTYIVQIPSWARAQPSEHSRESIPERGPPTPTIDRTVKPLNVGLPAPCPSNVSVSASPQEKKATYNQLVIQTDAQLVSLMRHINDLVGRNSLSIHPGKHGIMYICRWKVFLRAFVLSRIDLLDVVLKNGVHLSMVTGAADHSWRFPSEMVQSVTSARRSTFASCAARPRKPSKLLQMLIQRLDNAKTAQLALILYGSETHWLFCGFLRMDPDQRYKNNRNILLEPSTQANEDVRVRLRDYYCRAMAVDNSEQQQPQQQPQQQVNETAAPRRKLDGLNAQTTEGGCPGFTMTSNLQISSVISPSTSTPLAKFLVGLGKLAHNGPGSSHGATTDTLRSTRWLRLMVARDFSDLFIPSLNCNTSYGLLMSVIVIANKRQTATRVPLPGVPRESDGGGTTPIPRLYCLPEQGSSVFIGPFPTTQAKLDVILCQMVDGKMYTREEFQRLNSIHVAGKPGTVGCWVDILHQSGTPKLATTAVLTPRPAGSFAPSCSTQSRSLLKSNVNHVQQRSQSQAPDDDCVVILDDDDDGEEEQAEQNGGSTSTEELPATGDVNTSLKDVNKAEDMMSRIRAQLLTLKAGGKQTDGRVESSATVTVKQRPGCEADQRLNLLRLVEKTMEQTKEDKRKLANMVKEATLAGGGGMGREVMSTSATEGGGDPEVGRKRKSVDEEPTAALPASKVVRHSTPMAEEGGGPSSSKNGSTHSVSFRRNTTTRMSLPNPAFSSGQAFKVPQVVAKPATQQTTVTGGGSSSSKLNGSLRAPRPGGPPNMPARAMSVAMRPTNGIITNGKQQLTVKPLKRLLPPVELNEDDIVCLDDDDDEEDHPTPPPVDNGARRQSTTTVDNIQNNSNDEQQRCLAKLEYLKAIGQGKGFVFNAEKNSVKVKPWFVDWFAKADLNELKHKYDESSCSKPGIAAAVATTPIATISPATTTTMTLATPKATTKKTTTTATKAAISKTSSLEAATAPETTASGVRRSLPRTKVVPRLPASTTPTPPSVIATNCTTIGRDSAPSSQPSDDRSPYRVKYISPEEEAIQLAKPHRLGVLESNIKRLGLVQVVRLKQEVIIRVKQMTARGQHVNVLNLEEAVSLLNKFIQRNTYTYMPSNLSLRWEFKERSTPLAPFEDLTKIINQRCIVTRYGLFDTCKRATLKELQRSLPALYETLLPTLLAMQCCPKDLYESLRCSEDESKVYDKAVEFIAELKQAEQTLIAEERQLRKQVKQNEAKLERLRKDFPSGVGKDVATTGNNSESVIVIDDD
uniref:MGA conserved domain-containing protein n=1 Tax=Anopheles atroparvus TaxID=41427 RepID=A0AAG5DJ06_ANOAO